MEQKTSGIILRTRRFTETSLIAEWLTPDLGRVQTLAKGALRPKSPYSGKLDLYFEAEFTYQMARKSTLHNLREVQVIGTNPWLRRDLRALEDAAYATALIELTTEAETPLEGIFALLAEYLKFLEKGANSHIATIAFEMKLLHVIGLSPNLAKLSPAARQFMESSLQLSFDELLAVQPEKDQALECYRFLHGFIIYHCGKLPRNRPSL